MTFGALGELVFLPLASLVTLVTLVPVSQGLWHAYNLRENYLKSEKRFIAKDWVGKIGE